MTEEIKIEPGKTEAPKTERIAKRIARAGMASRREAERMILEGRVTVDGTIIASPALDVGPDAIITIDGTAVPKPERTRLWRYHKPRERLVSRIDPQGRPTIYADLPPELSHAIAVGRLDYNSEGLLLLTNDGELARKLELPSEGVVRHYRARAFGHIDQKALDRLAKGITVEDTHYGPIEAKLEEARGANAWISLSLSEGKNREVRLVLAALDLKVNRLIRTSYGPYQLGDLPPGAVTEVGMTSLIRDLGISDTKPKGWAKAKPKKNLRPGKNARIARRNKEGDERRGDETSEREQRPPKHRPGDRRPNGNLNKSRSSRSDGSRSSENRSDRTRPDANRSDGTRPDMNRTDGHRPGANRSGANPPDGKRSGGTRPDENRTSGNRPDRNRSDGHRPDGKRSGGNRPNGNRPTGNRPNGRGNSGKPGSGADRRR